MVIIQTEDINEYVKNISTLWQNTIKLNGLIMGELSLAIKS